MSLRLARMAAVAALATVLLGATAQAATPSAYVYATNWDRTVRQYAADDAGALAPLVPAPAAAGTTSKGAVATPDGRHLYVANESSGDISQYDIALDGSLTAKDPATVGTGTRPFGLAVSPDGEHVYVAEQGASGALAGTVGVYDVGDDGALTRASSAPTGQQPVQVSLSPDGHSAYVTNARSGSVSQYDVLADGSLTPKAPASVVAGPSPVGIAVSPDGANAYVANQASQGRITQFSIGADGALSPLDPSWIVTGSLAEAVVATAAGVYVTNLGVDTVSQYNVRAGGVLEAKPAGPVATPHNPFGLALAPDGRSLYVTGYGASAVAQYDVGSDGVLSPKTPPSVGAGSRPIAVVAVEPRDATAPTVDLRTPAEGAQYALDEQVEADYSCADEGDSGLASCEGDVADGAALDTSTAGPHSFTVVARDGEGNETTVTHGYTVVEPALAFLGFRGPIHDGSVVRAGDVVPVAFSLGGFHGLDVLADGSRSSVEVDCDDPGAPTGGSPALSEDDRGLRFRRWTGNYVFKWQSDRSWAGTCRTFVLTLADGSVQRLTVSFRSSWRWHRHW